MSAPDSVISWCWAHCLYEAWQGGTLVAQARDVDVLRRHYPDARDETA